jgi:hypothetical protein
MKLLAAAARSSHALAERSALSLGRWRIVIAELNSSLAI